ncbi:unnamed protein product [Rotaria magnacalcarata]|uniref:Uncharacterized protein n=1 Tax=Rotaria magnacalcarata TaxID=392030 RepID=A0A815D2D2_9BILA|nr:unnamed protein product [Rotaria magnacalcarata]CAF1576604.1 unnamed protein product [Rotaria magnacalcarata]CAF2101109.1 unnamed protein product [Rotaria magnacalcarata]CAF2122883.1 unnamed protein product [Rotaria magnacalcarata]CAF2162509.1 unnamed protein product [Rotaria magnacalcarata]
MLSRAYSFTISSINIAIGLILLCFNTEFYHNPSWKITIEQQQKYLLVDSLILSKRAHLFFTYGIICCIFLVAINLTNIILLVFVSSEIHVPKSSSLYINIFLFTLVFFTNLFDWLVCYDLCFYDKC